MDMGLQIGVTYLDPYLIHHPRSVPDFVNAWKELEGFKKEGLVRCVTKAVSR